jgi:hypothetical protein
MSEFKNLAGVRAWVASCTRADKGGANSVTVSVSVRSALRAQQAR